MGRDRAAKVMRSWQREWVCLAWVLLLTFSSLAVSLLTGYVDSLLLPFQLSSLHHFTPCIDSIACCPCTLQMPPPLSDGSGAEAGLQFQVTGKSAKDLLDFLKRFDPDR